MRKLLQIEPWQAIVLLTAVLCLLAVSPLHALELQTQRTAATDLEISGLLRGVSPGERRWLRWQDIRQLPNRLITAEGKFLQGTQTLRIVLLEDLLGELPLDPRADTVIAECTDGYTAVYTNAFTRRWKPFVVVEINGTGPAQWPLAGMPLDPGPYILSVGNAVAPGVDQLLDVAHKQPWATRALRVVREQDEFRSLHAGAWQNLSAAGNRGRQLWINSCHSCHTGPDDAIGGTRSGRPFAMLQTLAENNPEYVESYVRNPVAHNPQAKMTAHPHYSGAQFADLIAFMRGGQAASP